MTDIAVLLPHYNRHEGLHDALTSISDKAGVDVILVDDGSTHPPDKEKLSSQHPQVSNFIVIELTENKGIEYALNAGLRYIVQQDKYQYIARLDCGDQCHPQRFFKQRNFLKNNPGIAIVGTWVSFVDLEGQHLYYMKHPTDPDEIEKKMCTDQRLIHASIMFRKDAVKKVGFYSLQYPFSEDYDFIYRFVHQFKAANIPEVLMYCEVNPDKGISVAHRTRQLKNSIQIIWKYGSFKKYPLHFCYGIAKKSFLYILPYRLEWKIIELIRKYSNRGIYDEEK